MNKDNTVIMAFTHAYEEEHLPLKQTFRLIHCNDLRGTDCYCDPEAAQTIQERIAPFPPDGIHWIDSGDYHYLSKFWTDKIDYPFSLILFDHHPDMQPPLFDQILSCGSWVLDMLQHNTNLKKVCMIGASEKLREETRPYQDRILFWGEGHSMDDNAWQIFSRLHFQEPVYISIDKDVLDPHFAKTNWDQGSLSLLRLEEILYIILRHEQVIGIDICGELPEELGGSIEDEQLNGKTNRILQRLIESNSR